MRANGVRAGLVAMAAAMVILPACDNGDGRAAEDPLPAAPQVIPTPLEGFVIFPLTSIDVPSVAHVLLSNQGRNALVIDHVTIEGRDAAVFTLLGVDAAGASIASRDSLDLRVQFAPLARGAFRADLVVTSNAENFAELRIELVAPATEGSVPCDHLTASCVPDIVAVDETLVATVDSSLATPTLLARVFNVGGAPLSLQRYAIAGTDAAMFRLPDGTATPGDVCTIELGCPAGASCQAGAGGSYACAPVWLSAGIGLVVPVEYVATSAGSHSAELVISSSDADTPALHLLLSATHP